MSSFYKNKRYGLVLPRAAREEYHTETELECYTYSVPQMARRLKGRAKKETRLEKKARLARSADAHRKACEVLPYVIAGGCVFMAGLYLILSVF